MMDPSHLPILLKENENITLKVQTKLKLLREQLSQVRNQKVLLEESLAEVESFNYLAPTASSKNNTVDVNVAVAAASTTHHSEYYLRRHNISEIPRIDEIMHNSNVEEEDDDDVHPEQRKKMIDQAHKVLSLFPFPCDRFSWTAQSQNILKSLIRNKLEEVDKNKKRNKNISFTNADWEEIAEELRKRFYSSHLVDHSSNEVKVQSSLRIPSGPACKHHFFSLMKLQRKENNEETADRSSANDDNVEALILKAFGIIDENNTMLDGQNNNNNNNNKLRNRKNQVSIPQIISIQGESHGFVRNLSEEESRRISQFWKLYVEKILKICDNDDVDAGMTPQERRNQLNSLLTEVAFPENPNSAALTSFEKLSIINCAKQKFFSFAKNLPRISLGKVDHKIICGSPSSPLDDLFTRIKYFSFSESVSLRSMPEGPTSLINPYFSSIKMLNDYDIEKRHVASRISPELFVWLSDKNNNVNNNNLVVNNEKKLQIVMLLFTLLISSVGSGQERQKTADSDDIENETSSKMNSDAKASIDLIKSALADLVGDKKISTFDKIEEQFSSVYPTFLSRNSTSLGCNNSGGEILRAVSGSSVMTNRNLETIFNFLYFSVGGEFFKNPVDDVTVVGNVGEDADDVPLLDIAVRKQRVQMIRTKYQYNKLRQILNLPRKTFRSMD